MVCLEMGLGLGLELALLACKVSRVGRCGGAAIQWRVERPSQVCGLCGYTMWLVLPFEFRRPRNHLPNCGNLGMRLCKPYTAASPPTHQPPWNLEVSDRGVTKPISPVHPRDTSPESRRHAMGVVLLAGMAAPRRPEDGRTEYAKIKADKAEAARKSQPGTGARTPRFQCALAPSDIWE